MVGASMVWRVLAGRLFLTLGLLCAAGWPVRAEMPLAPSPRVALIIANATYRYESHLDAVVHDEQDMQELLEKLGFRVEVRRDLDRDALYAAATGLLPKLLEEAKGGTFLLYYSGHGVTHDGQGMLLPVDARITNEDSVRPQTVPVGEFMRKLDEATRGKRILGLVILDTCRTSPFVKGFAKGSVEIGAAAKAPRGTLVVSATQPGTAASPKSKRKPNSLYTAEFLDTLGQPDKGIATILAETANRVKIESDEAQVPGIDGDLSLGLVALRTAPPPPLSPASPDAAMVACNGLNGNRDPAVFTEYLRRFPQGPCAGYATVRLAELAPPPVLGASQPRPAPAPTTSIAAGRVFRDAFLGGRGEGPEMVVVPPGDFLAGAAASDRSKTGPAPQFRVRIGRAFAVGKHPVTFSQWEECYMDGGCPGPAGDGSLGMGSRPVFRVSWKDTQTYIKWLSEKTGQPYRLLSEAEREYATQTGSETAANFEVNGFGLHDMRSITEEWVEDCWHDDPTEIPADGSAWTAKNCDIRTAYDGSLWWGSRHGRAGYSHDVRGTKVGFRIARALSP